MKKSANIRYPEQALAAAASIRTILKRPERARDAVGFYDTREGNIARITTEPMTALYRKETRFPASSLRKLRCSRATSSSVARSSSPRVRTGPLCLPDLYPDLYKEVLAAPSASEAARRSPFGFDRAFAAIEWLYRAGYLERRDLDEL